VVVVVVLSDGTRLMLSKSIKIPTDVLGDNDDDDDDDNDEDDDELDDNNSFWLEKGNFAAVAKHGIVSETTVRN
jgi:hypothetical protein